MSGYINIDEDKSIEKWCLVFNCTKEDLIDAVYKIGPKAKSVQLILELNRKTFVRKKNHSESN